MEVIDMIFSSYSEDQTPILIPKSMHVSLQDTEEGSWSSGSRALTKIPSHSRLIWIQLHLEIFSPLSGWKISLLEYKSLATGTILTLAP
jgi:hypothetical protein